MTSLLLPLFIAFFVILRIPCSGVHSPASRRLIFGMYQRRHPFKLVGGFLGEHGELKI